jgi:hypothetical protein
VPPSCQLPRQSAVLAVQRVQFSDLDTQSTCRPLTLPAGS